MAAVAGGVTVELSGGRVLIAGRTWETGHLWRPLGAAYDKALGAWVAPKAKLQEARRLAGEVGRLRASWPGASPEWWVGRDGTAEGLALLARLTGSAPAELGPEDLARFLALAKWHHWQFAKSMPRCPHWYTLRRNWSSPADFEWAVSLIRACGAAGEWAGRKLLYLHAAEWKYWTMGAPLGDTTLINRAALANSATPRQPDLFD